MIYVPYVRCVPNQVYEQIVTGRRNVVRPRKDGQTNADENVISLEWLIPN